MSHALFWFRRRWNEDDVTARETKSGFLSSNISYFSTLISFYSFNISTRLASALISWVSFLVFALKVKRRYFKSAFAVGAVFFFLFHNSYPTLSVCLPSNSGFSLMIWLFPVPFKMVSTRTQEHSSSLLIAISSLSGVSSHDQ